jgi:hypothetical protein
MPWKKVTLTDGLKIDALQNGYVKRWQASGAREDAAVFINKGAPGGGLHLFFSPMAVVIAGPLLSAYAPVDCPEPDPTTVDVFVLRKG